MDPLSSSNKQQAAFAVSAAQEKTNKTSPSQATLKGQSQRVQNARTRSHTYPLPNTVYMWDLLAENEMIKEKYRQSKELSSKLYADYERVLSDHQKLLAEHGTVDQKYQHLCQGKGEDFERLLRIRGMSIEKSRQEDLVHERVATIAKGDALIAQQREVVRRQTVTCSQLEIQQNATPSLKEAGKIADSTVEQQALKDAKQKLDKEAALLAKLIKERDEAKQQKEKLEADMHEVSKKLKEYEDSLLCRLALSADTGKEKIDLAAQKQKEAQRSAHAVLAAWKEDFDKLKSKSSTYVNPLANGTVLQRFRRQRGPSDATVATLSQQLSSVTKAESGVGTKIREAETATRKQLQQLDEQITTLTELEESVKKAKAEAEAQRAKLQGSLLVRSELGAIQGLNQTYEHNRDRLKAKNYDRRIQRWQSCLTGSSSSSSTPLLTKVERVPDHADATQKDEACFTRARSRAITDINETTEGETR